MSELKNSLSISKKSQIKRLANELNGVLTKDELEEASIAQQTTQKQTAMSINDYPSLLSQRVQTAKQIDSFRR